MRGSLVSNVLAVGVPVFLAVASPAAADPAYITYPGAKAMGMGGAFTAVADDASAAWYNPAALLQSEYSNIMVEYGNAPDVEIPKVDNDASTYFLSYLHVLDSQKAAYSLFYTSPYKDLFGTDQTINILGAAGSMRFLESRDRSFFNHVDLGGSVEWVLLDFRKETKNDQSGGHLSGSLAVHAPIFENYRGGAPDWSVNFGSVYRFGEVTKPSGSNFGKPEMFDVGLAVSKSLSLFEKVTLSTQYGQTTWDDSGNGKRAPFDFKFLKVSSGLELQTIRPLGFISQVALRGGYYTHASGYQDDYDRDYAFKAWSTGGTLGVGDSFNVDFAYEQRTIDNLRTNIGDHVVKLFIVSLRYTFMPESAKRANVEKKL